MAAWRGGGACRPEGTRDVAPMHLSAAVPCQAGGAEQGGLGAPREERKVPAPWERLCAHTAGVWTPPRHWAACELLRSVCCEPRLPHPGWRQQITGRPPDVKRVIPVEHPHGPSGLSFCGRVASDHGLGSTEAPGGKACPTDRAAAGAPSSVAPLGVRQLVRRRPERRRGSGLGARVTVSLRTSRVHWVTASLLSSLPVREELVSSAVGPGDSGAPFVRHAPSLRSAQGRKAGAVLD